MNTNRSFFGVACRIAALSFLMTGTASMIEAQQVSPVTSAPRTPLFLASESTPLDLTSTSFGSSSSSSSDATPSYAKLDFDSAALGSSQPPPRRSYGRPSYHGGNTNPDGSSKYFALIGFGAALPVGITHKYETLSWGLGGGVGRNFNKTLGVDVEFNYDHFGLQGATLNNEAYIDNYCTAADVTAGLCSPAGPAAAGTGIQIDGNNHVWSFTLNPIVTIPTEGSLGAYVIVGGGYYHKVANFTTPTTEVECYYYCEEVEANATFDHYTSNAFGVNGGFGLTYKFSKFSNERFYVEARYVLMLDSQRTGVTAANVATSPLTATDFYPANSDRTTYIPIKAGIRF
jgi:opacity protein-like surface antigen